MQAIHTDNAPAALGPYSQARRVGDFVFTSGQIGINTASGKLAEGIVAQTHTALKNLGAILQEAGLGYNDVVKTTVFLKDLNDFQIVNSVYAQYFTDALPARSCVQVAALPLSALVEIECIAVVGG